MDPFHIIEIFWIFYLQLMVWMVWQWEVSGRDFWILEFWCFLFVDEEDGREKEEDEGIIVI